MPSCCLLKCGARKSRNQPQLTLHAFPKREHLRKKWLNAIGQDNINPRQKNWFVCSLHFEENCFNRTLDLIRLHDDSVPTIFPAPMKQHLSIISETENVQNPIEVSATTATLSALQLHNIQTTVKAVKKSFPTESSQRLSWIRIVSPNKLQWKPKDQSAVCSKHFLKEDLYETKSGLRRVRAGAVPRVNQGVQTDNEQITVNMCRGCLSSGNKLYPMKKYKLELLYENITGISLEDDTLPQQLCVECAQRLINCDKFRNKCLKANTVLKNFTNIHDSETPILQLIKYAEREQNQLTSTLTVSVQEPNHCDLLVVEDTDTQTESHIEDVDIKDESANNEIYLNEDLELSQELSKDGIQKNESIQEMPIDDNMVCNDGSDQDQDFVASDKDFSSDDSIPLERKRTKKVKVKTKSSPKLRKRQLKVKDDPGEPKVDRRRKPFLNDDLNETLFTITNLTFEEQVAEILKRQESANYKNAVFKCTECYKGFLDETAYSDHMSRHTKQCGEHQCEICKTHFKHPHALRKHITAHHTQRFSCNRCPYVTTHRQTARLHERWHKGTRYVCPHCREQFDKFTTYMGHVRIKHPSDFVCQLCGFSFVSQKGIELHKKLKHRLENDEIPEDGPLCELCNVRFKSINAHKQHLRVSAKHNTSDNNEREPNKRKSGRRVREMKNERRRNKSCNEMDDEKNKEYQSQLRKAEGPIPCEQCGLQLEDSRAYHSHFRRMHPDKNRTNYPSMKSPCMCEVCGRIFQSYALLKDHRWVHTGERPFRCEVCGKTFRMKQRLVSHRKVHAQVKRSYVCNLCGKQFSTHSNRQRHMFIHTGLKPFKCEMCGKSFKHASEKRAHITYVHLKKPWPKRSRGKRRSDSRQGPIAPQQMMPTGANDMDIVQPLWPCDPKDHMANIMDDKPVYYNLKI